MPQSEEQMATESNLADLMLARTVYRRCVVRTSLRGNSLLRGAGCSVFRGASPRIEENKCY